jgi:hypothetical protein
MQTDFLLLEEESLFKMFSHDELDFQILLLLDFPRFVVLPIQE